MSKNALCSVSLLQALNRFSDPRLCRWETGWPANTVPSWRARGKPLVSPVSSPRSAARPWEDPSCSPAEMPWQGNFRLSFLYFLFINYQGEHILSTHNHTWTITDVWGASMGTHREKLTKNGSRCFLCFYSEDVKTLIKMPACGHSEHLPQTPHPKSGSSNNRNTLFYTSGDQKSGLKLSVCPAFLQTPGAVLPSSSSCRWLQLYLGLWPHHPLSAPVSVGLRSLCAFVL